VSDFLVNLARRSAGLAPVVRARKLPVVADNAMDASPETMAARDAASSPTVVMMPVAPPAAATTGTPHATASVATPTPLVHTTSHVAQRAPVASPAASVMPAATVARVADAPVVAPRTAAHPTDGFVATIVPAAVALVDATRVTRDDEPRAQPVRNESGAIEARVDHAIKRESDDAPAPVVVTIQPAEHPVVPAPASHAEPAPERIVHVRIGAIEIHGADAASRTPASVAPAATAPAAVFASAPGGFDDFAALRSYAPWSW
jgi:hypothetical protein